MASVDQHTQAEANVPQYPIESVDNALRLLLLIAEKGELRLTDARDHLGVATSTAYRLLAMLQYRRFVRRDPATKLYTLGAALLGLSIAAGAQLDLPGAARPVMEKLCADLDETVTLGVLEGTGLVFVDAVECEQAVRVASRAGRTLPAHCTALGKALLAHLSTSELKKRYPRQKLGQQTPHSIARRSALEAELERVRELGYAVNRQESELGVSSVAMAICLADGLPIGGLNVSAPDFRIDESRIAGFVVGLRQATTQIVERLQ